MRGKRINQKHRAVSVLTVVCVLALFWVPCRGAETISLSGTWRHWDGPTTHVPITVPFSVPPEDTLEAYQKIFSIPAGSCNDLALLRFEHVVGEATVYFNGLPLGAAPSYLSTWFDVSGLLQHGTDNEVGVTIDGHRDNTTVPYAEAPWINYVGISGEVTLECRDGAALVGQQLQYDLAPDFSSVSGELVVQTAARATSVVTIIAAILEGDSGQWSLINLLGPTNVGTEADGTAEVTLPFSFASPRLWSPDDPALYSLYMVAIANGQVTDQKLIQVGFRDVRTQGPDILLNGEPILLKGVSRHDIYLDTGFIGTEAQMFEDMQRLKSAGVNYVRLVHYAHNPRILELADQLGLLVSGEVPAWANFWDPPVRDKLYAAMEGMIRRDTIHPSIFLWITGNARAHPMPYALEAQQRIKNLDRNRLATFVIDNDEYDPTTIAADVAFFHEAELDLYMKISWWFYYLEYLQDAWTNFPKDIPLVIAEFGREGNDREPVVVTETEEFFVSEDQQADAIQEILEAWRPHLPQYNAQEHIAGLIQFGFQDVEWPGVSRHLPNHIPSLHTGLVYTDRVPKLALETLSSFYSTLPTGFVGLPAPDDATVENAFDQPAGLGPTVNTINRDYGPSLSADGSRLYFAADRSSQVVRTKIYFSDLVADAWTAPQLVDMPQETEHAPFRRAPCISHDGQSLYFTRALVSGLYVTQTRIWVSEKVAGAWTQPVDLGDVINFPDPARITSDPSMSADGNTLFLSSDRPGGLGATDLWMADRVGGVWTAPVNLGATINSAHHDSEPSISADGQTLYFSSNRPGGMGSTDIWVSHLVSGAWTTPKNLGPQLNSTGADREPEVAKDGSILLFTGIRSGGEGLSDLWAAQRVQVSSRQSVTLDGPWLRSTDSVSSTPITVPYSAPPVDGVVSYQRLFTVPQGVSRKLAVLKFDGIVGDGTVYLNGQTLGTHSSYTPFAFDVTDVLDYDNENDLVVAIDDHVEFFESIPGISTWTNFSGIQRSVTLELGRGVNIGSTPVTYDFMNGYERVDGHVSVRAIGRPGAVATITGGVFTGPAGASSKVATLDASGDLVIGADGTGELLVGFTLDFPALWSPSSPTLYTLQVEATSGSLSLDEHTVRIGFRDVQTRDNDILLNGAPLTLLGLSRHDIYPGTGFVGSEEQMVADMQRIKSTGANYVRLIHYPHHPRILELADELGLLVSEELPAWANFWDEIVREKLYDMWREMFDRDSHHPSLFLWITGTSPTLPQPYGKEVTDLIRSRDPNRLVSFVIDDSAYDEQTILDDVNFLVGSGFDIYMKNTYWYNEPYADIRTLFHQRMPSILPTIIAEFGQEGRDDGPIFYRLIENGFIYEDRQAGDIYNVLNSWRSFLPMYGRTDHISGVILFNDQDLEWPGSVELVPTHVAGIFFGLVRVDRTPKPALETVTSFFSSVPNAFVGPPVVDPSLTDAVFDFPFPVGPPINTPRRDLSPSLSSDGHSMYFATEHVEQPGIMRLRVATRQTPLWLDKPHPLNIPPLPDSALSRSDPIISTDGQTLYFTTGWPAPGNAFGERICQSTRVGAAWSRPTDLGDLVNGTDRHRYTVDPCVSADGQTLLFTSDRLGGEGWSDLWMTQRVDGEWSVPVNLGPTVNSPYHDEDPALTPDGKALYFTSDRPGGLGGRDIWVSRKANGAWMPPRNLGAGVNSIGDDRDPAVFGNDWWLMFTGARDGGSGMSDIWTASSPCARTDVDGDFDVDPVDLAAVQLCFGGSDVQVPAECAAADSDGDGDVDQADLDRVQVCLGASAFAP